MMGSSEGILFILEGSKRCVHVDAEYIWRNTDVQMLTLCLFFPPALSLARMYFLPRALPLSLPLRFFTHCRFTCSLPTRLGR